MKKIFSPELLGQLILQFLILGLFMSFIQYKQAPLTAAETLKKENFLNSKKETYFQALELINRSLANTQFNTNGKLSDTTHLDKGGKFPNVTEINLCITKLAIFSNDKEIPLCFIKIFHDSLRLVILERAKIINLIRKDIGDSDPLFDSNIDEIKFIVPDKSNY